METQDLVRIKRQLAFAIDRTFKLEKVDTPTGIIILQSIMADFLMPAYEFAVEDKIEYQRKLQELMNERLCSDQRQDDDVSEQSEDGDNSDQ